MATMWLPSAQLTNGNVGWSAQVHSASAGLQKEHGGGLPGAIDRNIGRYAAANLRIEHGSAAGEVQTVRRPEVTVNRSREVAGCEIVHDQGVDAAGWVRGSGRRAYRVDVHLAIRSTTSGIQANWVQNDCNASLGNP